ncbi:MAG: hypothetical protein WCO26_15720 [Deltaproteobacteria bacterium]
MKWITPLWSDPVGWSEWVAKTKLRVFIWTLVHAVFVFGGLFAMHLMLRHFPSSTEDDLSTLVALSAGALPIVLIGIGYPAMYLYAMFRMIKMLKGQESQNTAPEDTARKLADPQR